ncbi:DUF4247 domain-containing protein [Bacillus salitolerans]|uniref:DUF4247 domain-containing protein n=1 Tax=Bacillus salitolerans TaxID=1437434 RepID=A0ABW4LPK8_9BACI
MKRLFMIVIVMTMLASCGVERGIPSTTLEEPSSGQSSAQDNRNVLYYAESNFPLIDVVKSSFNQQDMTRIFLAENKTIEDVANELLEHVKSKPIEVSQNTGEKQVLVYDNYFATLTKDPNNESNTFLEIATYGFVRDNYQPDFFDGLLVLWLLDEVLDVDDWGKKQKKRCTDSGENCYRTYGNIGGGFKGPVGQPSLRGGSSNVRGGGPGTGK